jgi:hypothetical protein
VVDTVFARLFEGIALSRSQEARVCDILTTLQQEQLVQDLAASVSQITEQVRRTALQVRRDSALRALLEGDADRALLDERLARAPGPRGRTGGPPPDLTAGGRRGGGGGGGERVGGGARRGGGGGGDTLGMRVGRGGQRGDLRLYIEDIRAVFDSTIAEATFHRLFEGIPLTAEQESRARRLIHDTQKEMRPQVTLAAQPRLRLDPVSGMVTMPAESADELSALLGSDADRALLRSRILVVPR